MVFITIMNRLIYQYNNTVLDKYIICFGNSHIVCMFLLALHAKGVY